MRFRRLRFRLVCEMVWLKREEFLVGHCLLNGDFVGFAEPVDLTSSVILRSSTVLRVYGIWECVVDGRCKFRYIRTSYTSKDNSFRGPTRYHTSRESAPGNRYQLPVPMKELAIQHRAPVCKKRDEQNVNYGGTIGFKTTGAKNIARYTSIDRC